MSEAGPFWLVWHVGGSPPREKHDSPISAMQEAGRLARKHPEREFVVMESLVSATSSAVEWKSLRAKWIGAKYD